MTGSFRRVLEVHPDGMQEVFHWSAPDRQFAIEYTYPMANYEQTLTYVKDKAADTGGWSKSRDMQHVGSIPTVALFEMAKRYGPEVFKSTQLQRKALDDPDFRYLRVAKVIT
jgi:hypothetical protein